MPGLFVLVRDKGSHAALAWRQWPQRRRQRRIKAGDTIVGTYLSVSPELSVSVNVILMLTTVPDAVVAQKLAEQALAARLAACVSQQGRRALELSLAGPGRIGRRDSIALQNQRRAGARTRAVHPEPPSRMTPPKSSRGKRRPLRPTASGLLLKLNALFMFNGLYRRARRGAAQRSLSSSHVCSFCCSAGGMGAARAADDFLDPAVAFKFSATEQPGEILVHYKIANGYYMYRERFASLPAMARLRSAIHRLPPGHVKFDHDLREKRRNLSRRVDDPDPGQAGGWPIRSRGHLPRLRGRGHLLSANGAGVPRGSALHCTLLRIMETLGGAGQTAANSTAATPSSWYEQTTSADYAQSLLQGGSFLRRSSVCSSSPVRC